MTASLAARLAPLVAALAAVAFVAAGTEIRRTVAVRAGVGRRLAGRGPRSGGVAAGLAGVVARRARTSDRWFAATPAGTRTDVALDRARVSLSAGGWLAVRAALAGVAATVVVAVTGGRGGAVAAAAAAVLAVLGANRWLSGRQAAQLDALAAQLPATTRLLANALRAGRSVPGALSSAAAELADPAGPALARVVAEIELGAAVDAALERLVERLPSPELRVVVTAIHVQRHAGGDLAAALEHLGRTMVERERLRRELRAATAQARFTSTLVVALPVVVVLGLAVVAPSAVAVLVASPAGLTVLGVSAALQAAGVVAIRRIATVPP